MEQATLIEGFEPATQAPPSNAGKGRPRGARNRKHRALEQAARSRALPLLATVLNAAEAGDMMAAKIIFDRIWPKPRTAPMHADLPAISTPADVRLAMLEVIQRVGHGEITSDDGAALVSMMRDVLDAHSIKTLSPGGDNDAIAGGDVRQVLAEKLGRIIEARAWTVDDAGEPADDD